MHVDCTNLHIHKERIFWNRRPTEGTAPFLHISGIRECESSNLVVWMCQYKHLSKHSCAEVYFLLQILSAVSVDDLTFQSLIFGMSRIVLSADPRKSPDLGRRS